MAPELTIGERRVGDRHPTYFVADIGANHDGELERARELIQLAAEAGAGAAKFQNFTAETIVSEEGFRALGDQKSHQAAWPKPPHEVYQDAALPPDWTPTLATTCAEAGIDYFTSPYSIDLVDAVDSFVPVFKIGSGDVTWIEIVEHIAAKGKPVLLATGASALNEVERAVAAILAINDQLAILQCNTNYTGRPENVRFVNLNVLRTFRERFPTAVLGLSDHTPGDTAVLGAVALGARIIEKHFTDDTSREGPDHSFSMTPRAWRRMVERTRQLEAALGDGVKRVEENESDTVVLQRRALRATERLERGKTISQEDLFPLRPCPPGAIEPHELGAVVGRRLRRTVEKGDTPSWADLE